MSKRNYNLYLQDILESIKKVRGYTDGLDFRGFQQNIMAVDAVTRNLEIIGEAVARLPKDLKKKHPEIPWGQMRDMRNKVIHEYFGVDLKILWETVKTDLPQLEKQLKDVKPL